MQILSNRSVMLVSCTYMLYTFGFATFAATWFNTIGIRSDLIFDDDDVMLGIFRDKQINSTQITICDDAMRLI